MCQIIFDIFHCKGKQVVSQSDMSVAMKHASTSGTSFEGKWLIEGCLSGEAALIILDTLEALMQDAKELDDMQAALSKTLKVLLHLLECNESISVMGHIFATQRAVLVKVTQQISAFIYLLPQYYVYVLCTYVIGIRYLDFKPFIKS